MNDEKVMIKDDINFLENPNWVVSEKHKLYKLCIDREKGKYLLKSVEGLPNRFDKIVLYYLLYKSFENAENPILEIITSRYDVAKNVFFNVKNPGKNEYNRIMMALKKWHCIAICFEGIFYEGDNYTIRYFSVIDDVILDKKTKKLYIKFNQQYIKQLQESKFYKFINFHEYKKLTRPISARLYEILVKNFKERLIWHIKIDNLAQKLTMEKRARAKDYYPSDILAAVKPAVKEINKNTGLAVSFKYDKQTDLCSFKQIVDIQELNDETHLADLSTILNMLPAELQSQNSIKKMINEYVTTQGIEYVSSNISYALENADQNLKGYLKKALEHDWGCDYRVKQEEKLKLEEKKEALKQQDLMAAQNQESLAAQQAASFQEKSAKCLEYFKSLRVEEQQEIIRNIEKDLFMRFIPDENTRIMAYLINQKIVEF